MVESLGWLATGVFVSSYLCRSARALRATQMAGATMWMLYGALMHAAPVFVANLLVLSVAAWTLARDQRRTRYTSQFACSSPPSLPRPGPDAAWGRPSPSS